MDIIRQIREELNVEKWQVEAAVKLIDEGNTIPFISRYRKEATGSLDDEQLRNLYQRLNYLRSLEEKKAQVLKSIEEQGKLTEELKKEILAAQTMVVVEDLYRPYRPKRRTRAGIARERGLEGLARFLLSQEAAEPVEAEAGKYVDPQKEVPDAAQALQGALDIIAEEISDEAQYRLYIRNATVEEGVITSAAKDEKAESVYEMYYRFEEPVRKIAGHRVLALNRGEAEKVLTVKVNAPEERILRYLEKQVITKDNPYTSPALREAVRDSYERLIAPAIEREIRNDLTEKAEDGAISVFGKNLEQLLMQPPITGKVVLGWDPAFRTGCKLAVVDATGKVLDTKVIYPTQPQNKVKEAKAELRRLIDKYNVELISVGNGTASRESEQVIVELIRELNRPLQYVIVNEAGASVYSASELATEEFPNFDVGQRSAASIARRLQDPLAELVKIDPQSIGVGQYQHDMNQKKLSEALSGVVEDCVNHVGVDLNTASASLLEYISGINKTIARNIVDYREKNGRFVSRKQLLKVPKLGPKAYEQCAGFLRILEGENPLDATSVHPESYEAAKKLLDRLGITMEELRAAQRRAAARKAAGRRSDLGAERAAGRPGGGLSGQPGGSFSGQLGGGFAGQPGVGRPGGKTAGAGGGNNRQPAGKGGVQVRNTNTAMGRALAAALGGAAAGGRADAAGNGGPVNASGSGAAASAMTAGKAQAAAGGAQAGKSGEAAGGSGAAEPGLERITSLERRAGDKKKLAAELGIGEITLTDILRELEKPARDPRDDMPKPILRSDVLEMKDLKPGMILKGTVRNVIDFGAFVDIGVHQDGLVHISQITDRYIKHPLEAVSVGDIVEVRVLTVDVPKKRIGLTMKINGGNKA